MNLLGKDLIFEVTVTAERTGQIRCAMATLDADAPVARLVEGMLKCGYALIAKAEQLAAQHRVTITTPTAGGLEVS